jgi:zinc protease
MSQLSITIRFAAALALATAACGSPQASTATPVAPPPAAAEPAKLTAEKVIDDYLEATGGRAAHEKLTSSYAKGKVTLEGMNLGGTFETWLAAPRMMYSVIELQGLGKIESGCDGEVAWEKNAMSGSRILQGAERDRQLRAATFNGELDPKKLYKSIELAPDEQFEGRTAHKLVFTAPDDSVENAYYDVETHLLIGQTMVAETQMGKVPTKVVVSDYRTIDGMTVPFSSSQEAGGAKMVLTTELVSTSIPPPPGIFDLPADIKALQKPAAH